MLAAQRLAQIMSDNGSNGIMHAASLVLSCQSSSSLAIHDLAVCDTVKAHTVLCCQGVIGTVLA